MKQKDKQKGRKNFMRIVLAISLLLTIQLTMIARGQDSPAVGKWEKYSNGVTMAFILDKDLNYTVDFESDGNIEVRGTYTVEENTITFTDKPGGYASPDPGIYTFKIEEDKLIYTIKNDPTAGRSGLVAGTWTKAKE